MSPTTYLRYYWDQLDHPPNQRYCSSGKRQALIPTYRHMQHNYDFYIVDFFTMYSISYDSIDLILSADIFCLFQCQWDKSCYVRALCATYKISMPNWLVCGVDAIADGCWTWIGTWEKKRRKKSNEWMNKKKLRAKKQKTKRVGIRSVSTPP